MSFDIFTITPAQMEDLTNVHLSLDDEQRKTLLTAGTVSVPLLAGLFRGELMCFVGFVPETMLSNKAYLWLYATAAAGRNKTIFGRKAVGVISRALEVYPTLFGHCRDSKSIRWLMTLGAEIEAERFIIRRAT